MTRVGIVTGLAAEARLFGRQSADKPDTDDDAPLIDCAGPGRGTESAERLIAAGVAGLLSFGLAGGLDPRLKPGDLVCPTSVLSAGGEPVATDRTWRTRLMTEARTAGIEITDDPLFGADAPVADSAAKWRLARETGAVAVDMESHAVAAAAEAHGLPFIALRAVADSAGRSLPPAALAAVDGEGRIRGMAVVAALLRRPGQIPAMIGLARDTRAAMSVLGRAAGFGSLFLGLV